MASSRSLIVTPAVFSDYRSSGISQTLGDPAAQLNVMLSHASGLYAGVWTSNVDFGHDDEARQELEYYAGYYWQINDNISLGESEAYLGTIFAPAAGG